MKFKIIMYILCVIGCFSIFNVNAQEVDASFNYQGQLLDDNTPANDTYDITVDLLDDQGIQFGSTSTHLNTLVTNGLFSIDVNFDIASFDGYADVKIRINVRKSSDGGAYTTLSPNQTIQAVPLATNLTNGNAVSGEIMKFNGFQWVSGFPIWNVNGSNIGYTGGKVGIGTSTPAADLTVEGTTDGDLFRVRADNITKLYVDDNGGTAIGQYQVPPENGLYVTGDTKQLYNSNGMMKYMLIANCAGGSSSIIRSYNGTNRTRDISLIKSSGSGFCTIKFPSVISDRFWSVTASGTNPLDKVATCLLVGTNDSLYCKRRFSSTNSGSNGEISIWIF